MANKKCDLETIQKALLGDKEACDILNQNNCALACPLCGHKLQEENMVVGGSSLDEAPHGITLEFVKRHPNTGCLLDGNVLHKNQLPLWNKRATLLYDTVANRGFTLSGNPVSESPNVCEHELEEIRYCQNDEYLHYDSDLLTESDGEFKRKKKLMYCKKCGALFAKDEE